MFMATVSTMQIVVAEDGRARCWWGTSTPDYRDYHDTEWGFGVTDDARLFEKICLEGFQSGLSWLTILRKRDNFRAAFGGFDPEIVAGFDDSDIERLLGDAGIIRHRGKVTSTVNNAGRALETIEEHGSLAAYFYQWFEAISDPPEELAATTPASVALAKDLKRRGWSFVGPTTAYAFMQAMGLVNDHLEGCWVREAAETARQQAAATLR